MKSHQLAALVAAIGLSATAVSAATFEETFLVPVGGIKTFNFQFSEAFSASADFTQAGIWSYVTDVDGNRTVTSEPESLFVACPDLTMFCPGTASSHAPGSGFINILVTPIGNGFHIFAYDHLRPHDDCDVVASGPCAWASGAPNGVLTIRGVTSGTYTVEAIPEPATWAMMIMGFGLVGGALRRRRMVDA